MDKILDFFSIDMVIVLILGSGLFFLQPDLQSQIVGGLIGYMGRGIVSKTLKNPKDV